MHANRIRTETAAKIIGVTAPFVVEKMRRGEWDLGELKRGCRRDTAYIFANKLAKHVERSLAEIDAAVEEIERKESE